MLKRILLAFALVGVMVACNTPAGTTTPASGGVYSPSTGASSESPSVGAPSGSESPSVEPSAS